MEPSIVIAAISLLSTIAVLVRSVLKDRTTTVKSDREELRKLFAENRKELELARKELTAARKELESERLSNAQKDIKILQLTATISALQMEVTNLKDDLETWKEHSDQRHKTDKEDIMTELEQKINK